MQVRVLAPILFALVALPVLAAPTSCEEYVRSRDPDVGLLDGDACYCGSQLSSLTVTLPPGLRIEAVCALHLTTLSESRRIDLTREQVSLDSYTDGEYPQGFVYLSGTMQAPLAGTVYVEEADAGTLWFGSRADRRGPVFREYHLKEFDFDSEDDYEKLGAPRPESLQGGCREAEATLRIRDPVVLLGDTDEAGTGADFDVISVSEFAPCVKIEGPGDPVARLVKGQPADVVAVIMRIGGCNYWQGDWPYAEEGRKSVIAAELAKLNCPSVAAEEERVRDKYVDDAAVIAALDAAKAIEY